MAYHEKIERIKAKRYAARARGEEPPSLAEAKAQVEREMEAPQHVIEGYLLISEESFGGHPMNLWLASAPDEMAEGEHVETWLTETVGIPFKRSFSEREYTKVRITVEVNGGAVADPIERAWLDGRQNRINHGG